jgi:hypothetical protein
MKLLLLRLSPVLDRKLSAFVSRRRISKSEAVQAALDAYLASDTKAADESLDQVIELIGRVREPDEGDLTIRKLVR